MSTVPVSNSIYNTQVKPRYQAMIAIGLLILSMAVLKAMSDDESGHEQFWEASLVILMAFGLFNAVFSIPYKDQLTYFRNSIFSYALVAAVGILLATWFSGVSIGESGSFRWLYAVFTFSYLVFVSIVNAMRKIIEIAKKQDARLRGEDPIKPIDPRMN